MEKPALLFVTLLLLSSCPWQLHAQTTDADAAIVADDDATTVFNTEPTTEAASTLMPTDTEPGPESTSEYAILDHPATPELLTTVIYEPVTTTTTEEPTTVTLLQTTPETTWIPEETTQIIPIAIQTTRPGPTTPSVTSQIIPETTQTTRSDPISTPPPTTPTMVQSTSTSASAPPESTSAVTPKTTAETTSTTSPPPMTLHPHFPVIPISSKPYLETSFTTTGATDRSGTSNSSGIPGVPIVLGDSSSAVDPGSQSNKSLWLTVIVAALVAALASIACIALVVRRRRQKQGFGDTGVSGRGQRSRRKGKKKGEEDVWAGPVLMGGVERDECDGNGDVEDNNNGGPADGTDPMLSTFAPSEDEEKAVGAKGTKEAKKWEEQSPLLYIDEDAEEVEVEGIPANQQDSSHDGQSAEKTDAEGAVAQKKGEVRAETGGVLDGAVAFCQTTAV
ncbi:hypothetical protein AALO_G00083530 [Alosa alosa]|uniref:Uncharacterized protein n=1 Tax=Alosa alosa TaxID=278164 RepID=A0AAV6GYA3_9TELE|nr:mucin-2 [Alosa alosa]XP_048101250.1 mucin-2 [Alosa alosa]KAG5279970.1 hypothetical protein AALO_G00083530 [Alosa alosa]